MPTCTAGLDVDHAVGVEFSVANGMRPFVGVQVSEEDHIDVVFFVEGEDLHDVGVGECAGSFPGVAVVVFVAGVGRMMVDNEFPTCVGFLEFVFEPEVLTSAGCEVVLAVV